MTRRWDRRVARAAGGALLLAMAAGACGGDDPAAPAPVEPESRATLELDGIPAWDTVAHGPLQAWFADGDGTLHPSDRFAPGAGSVVVGSPIAEPDRIMVSWEPPGDTVPGPSGRKLLGGRFEAGRAELSVTGYLTPNLPLEPEPGVHVLTTFAHLGTPDLPQRQDAGLWVVNPAKDTLSGDHYQDFTPLTEGWLYEGWVVRDLGTSDEVWLSYGKFHPDGFRQARFRDDTGLGPFSGKEDYERALPDVVRVPGDDWLANPLGVPVPGGVSLPLDLNGDAEAGVTSRWTHVITVEPYEDRDEDPWLSEPTFLRPYANPVGEAPPETLRTIEFRPDGVPTGSALLAGGS